MKIIFNPLYITNDLVFGIYVAVILVIIITTIILIKKVMGDKK